MPRFAMYVGCYIVCGVPRWIALALGWRLGVVVAVVLVAGLASGFLNPILGAIQFERIPEALMGRVSAMSLAASWSLMPLGGLVAGFAVGALGLVPALLAFGAAYFVTTMAPLVSPSWRSIDGGPPPALDERAPSPSSHA